jgi:hypothetical protein
MVRRFATVVKWMAEGLAVETLSHWTGVSEFLPRDNTMTKFMYFEDVTYIGARWEGKHKNGKFGHDFSCFLVGFGQLKNPWDLYVVGD